MKQFLQKFSPLTKQQLVNLKSSRDLTSFIDQVLELPSEKIDQKLRELAAQYPQKQVADLEKILTKKYLRNCALTSGGVGASAAVPALGTGTAVGLSLAELGGFYYQTAQYVLEICRLHGIKVEEKEKRRALVTAALLGEEGAKLISDQLGLSTLSWARHNLKNISSPTLRQVNKKLAKYTVKKGTEAGAKKFFGRLIPFGIGAAVGYWSGRKSAQRTVEGIRAALGEIRPLAVSDFLVELAPVIPINADSIRSN